ncbi:het domain-containing protein [Colletotrichum kahawae]|uniref:Het domain-containing protein n=1 Tax=Colletotrichum kahawae TaxID=34407 RepID=A0AAD9YFN8_COLKA|nr:het domain-containing protein [Colletotrichum kahawae]
MMKATPYVYTPLQTNRLIRLLTLSPGPTDGALEGQLEVVSIDNVDGDYETISYVWGNPERTQRISCNGMYMSITDSLHGALKRLRLTHSSRRLWADQICINQDNVSEKSEQIPLMDIIYRNASRVLVWLGNDNHGIAAEAFRLVKDLGVAFGLHQGQPNLGHDLSNKLGHLVNSRDLWSPLRELTRLPWFTRVWVVQEIGGKAPGTLFWGEAYIDWEILYSVCKAINGEHHLRKQVDVQTPKITYMYRRFIEPDRTIANRHANRFSFLYELHRSRHLVATDPRDRVFAMLGHYSIRNGLNQKLREMNADYTKTVEQVFTDVASRALVGDDSSLLTLAAVQHHSLPSSRGSMAIELADCADYCSLSPNGLPSWVPDWRLYQSHILSEPTSPHHAAGRSQPDLRADEDSKTLHIKGVIVDIVAACSEPFRPREFHVNGSEWSVAIQEVWRDVCGQSSGFNLSKEYLPNRQLFQGGEIEGLALFAYVQTLSNACVATAWQDNNHPYESIPTQQWFAHGVSYLIRAAAGDSSSYAVSDDNYNKLRESAAGGDAAKWARAANGASCNRKFARTRDGYYVLGPRVMEPGDVICVLYGGKMPFCLRPWGKKNYLLVGECYVHGIMDGEIIDGARSAENVFDIV